MGSYFSRIASAPASEEEQQCLFVTLGMIVLDEIHFPAQDPIKDVIGGSGAYCHLGARLFCQPPRCGQLGWLIHTGDDFPSSVREELQSWDTRLLETCIRGQLSTRGELIYQDTTFGPKKFRYTTKPLKVEPKYLVDTPLLSSPSFHFLSTPNDQKDQVRDLLSFRDSLGLRERPAIIWEPAPPSCLPENLSAFLEAIKFVDILSPNHIELAAFFSIDLSNDEPFDRSIIEELAQKCLASGIGPEKQGTVVVRAGHEGCCVYSRKQKEFVWLPPFYKDSPKVIDPTGAGNAFLGGFAIGLRETADDVLASCYGSIASTFALEQIGLPILKPLQSITTDGAAMSSETWNGTIVRERLQEYTSRLGISLADSLIPPLETRLSHL
ncbi:hypothetical protein VE00_04503 [Pseudogymnoascus sp. WSF 3629]|nr:hypothetical protein VE00_04503 [Pseudogymnoascus sp. WSF 3629]